MRLHEINCVFNLNFTAKRWFLLQRSHIISVLFKSFNRSKEFCLKSKKSRNNRRKEKIKSLLLEPRNSKRRIKQTGAVLKHRFGIFHFATLWERSGTIGNVLSSQLFQINCYWFVDQEEEKLTQLRSNYCGFEKKRSGKLPESNEVGLETGTCRGAPS